MAINPCKIVMTANTEEVTVKETDRGKTTISTYRASNPHHQVDAIIQSTPKGPATFTRTVQEKGSATDGWEGIDPHLAREAQFKLNVARSLFQTRWGDLQEALSKGGLQPGKVEAIEGAVGKVEVSCRLGEQGELTEVILNDGLTEVVVQDPKLLSDVSMYRDKMTKK